jgi:hypothetical protein
MGILERGGNVRTVAVANRKRKLCKAKSRSTSRLVLLDRISADTESAINDSLSIRHKSACFRPF